MYYYRNLTPEQQQEVVEYRKQHRQPWHSPPHWEMGFSTRYLVTAACYNHAPIIGESSARMTECEESVLNVCRAQQAEIFAWCVLPNHYHIIVNSPNIKQFCQARGKFHGRSSHDWNAAENQVGRKVWYRAFDREIRSLRHFWASVNYIHHNPVHHGYTQKWQDWPWSSAPEFLAHVGRARALQIWQEYPVLDYGKGWDV